MRLVIGSDHAGFELKTALAASLKGSGHEIVDVGTYSTDPVDYPDFALAVGRGVLDGRGERGVLICGSGVGASVAANKVVGIRAGLCHDTYSAHQGVEHDDGIRRARLGPPPYEVRPDETGATGNEQPHVRSGQRGRAYSAISARFGFARSRSESSGRLMPQSPAISGSSQATPSSSAAL